jgi:uncharacterized protein YijF (DUF1287 family)
MDKTIVCLMCENIRARQVDLDKMFKADLEKTIDFLHNQYEEARLQLNQQHGSQSVSLESFLSPERTST